MNLSLRYGPVTLLAMLAASVVLLPPFAYILKILLFSSGPGICEAFSLFEHRQVNLLINSLAVGLGSTLFCLLIGVPLGVVVSKTDLPCRKAWQFMFLLPALIPPVIQAVTWTTLSTWLKSRFHFDIYTIPGCIIVLGICYFPFIVLLTSSGLKSVDSSLEEAALQLGGSIKALFRVSLPLAMPHIMTGAALVFMLCTMNFCVPDMLRVRVYPVEIFVQYSAFYNEHGAMILAVPLFLILMLVLVAVQYLMKGKSFVQIGTGRGVGYRYVLGMARWPVACLCVVVLSMALLLPVMVLAQETGSIQNFVNAVKMSLNETFYTLILAIFSGGLSAIAVIPASYLAQRVRTNGLSFLIIFFHLLPLAIPATAFGLALIGAWNRSWLNNSVYGSSFMVVLAYTGRYLPYAFAAVVSGMHHVGEELEEVARLYTASEIKIIRRIVLPLLIPSISVGFLITFILSLGELGATLLVLPAGRETLLLKMYNLMHYGAHEQVAALSLFLMAVIGCLFILAVFLFRPATWSSS